jgi:uncharacterized protein (TIGR02147 family)
MDIFEYNSYRKFINDYVKFESKTGARSRLARAAHCSPSWMTRALSGDVQLTPDQALGVAKQLHLGEDETDYLLLLVEFERSSTSALRSRIESKLAKYKILSKKLSSTMKTDSVVSDSDSSRYYTSWIYSAAHVACMIRGFSTDELEKFIKAPEGTLAGILVELKKMGLLTHVGGKWNATSKSIHLSADHPMSKVGHANWRNHTISQLHGANENDLHYSAIHCLSKKDKERIRKTLKEMIIECRGVIEPSEPEELSVFCLDWYTP